MNDSPTKPIDMTNSIDEIDELIPSALRTRKQSALNKKYIAGGMLLLVFVVFLGYQMVVATTSTGAYFMTVDEVHAESTTIVGQRVRVNGQVVDGSEDWNAQEIVLKFSIQDEESVQVLPIVFKGPRPDNFHRAADAIVEGQLLADGSFQADTLLLKCPSRYEEEPEEIFVEASG